LPLRPFDLFRLYYEKEATDVKTPLQKGEKFEFDLPFIAVKLYEGAKTFGVLAKKGRFCFRGELSTTKETMYLHHAYPYEGFSYKGIVLGHPYGRDVLHIFAQLKYESTQEGVEIEVGFVEQPFKKDMEPVKEMERYYLSLVYHKRWGKFEFSPVIRVDFYDGNNYAEFPLQYKLRKGRGEVFTVGFRLSHFF